MPRRRDKWIFFDLDGTLIQSMDALYASYLHFLKRFRIRGSRGEFRALCGPLLAQVVARLKRIHGLKPSRAGLSELYQDSLDRFYHTDTTATTGASRLLDHLRSKKFRTGLVTSASKRMAMPILEKFGWLKLFDQMTFGSDVEKGKPHPEIYERAMTQARCGGTAFSVAVEDSVPGVLAAKGAGLTVIGLAGETSAEVLARSGADRVVRRLRDVVPTIAARFHETACRIVYRGEEIEIIDTSRPNRKGMPYHLFCLNQKFHSNGRLRLTGRFLKYDDFIVKMRTGRKMPPALAVSGLTVWPAPRGKKYLVGQRAKEVSCYQKYWEFVPAGGIDTRCLNGRRIDYKQKLIQEFCEESGLSASSIAHIRTFGVVRDTTVNTYEIICEIVLKKSLRRPKLQYNRREHTRMGFVDLRGLKKMYRGHYKMIPILSPILKAYGIKIK